MLYVTYEEGNKDWDENGDNTEKAKIIKLTKTELELQWEDIDIDGNLIFEDEVLTFQRIQNRKCSAPQSLERHFCIRWF